MILTGRTGHLGSDGSRAVDRMNRYGEFKVCMWVCGGGPPESMYSDAENKNFELAM